MKDRNRSLLLAAVPAIAILFFIVDVSTSQAIAVWMLYMPVVLLSVRLQTPRYTLLTAAGCSVLALIDLVVGVPALPIEYALTNRALGLSVIWLTAFVGLVINHQTAELVELKTRQAEQAQRLLLSKAIANLNEGVLITDGQLDRPGPRIVFVNPAVTTITGYTPEELVGQSPRLLQGKRTAADVLDRLRRELAAGRAFQGEMVNYRKDGSAYEVEVAIAPVFDTDGHIVNYVAVQRDVTERKQAEAALRDREARLRAILETAVDAILTVDEYGTIESVNPAVGRLFGYDAEEMTGQNIKMLLPAPYRELPDGDIAAHLRAGIRHVMDGGREVQGRRKNGTTVPVEVAISEIGEGYHSFTCILHDLSSRKALEREVVESATLEEQRIARELHDGVGQELTGLGMMAGALARRLPKEATADQSLAAEQSLATKLARGLERVHRQVQLLCRGLMLTELDAEGLRVALEELSARTAEQAGISCCFQCPESMPVPDPTTAKHLYRIAQEAVSNALRHGQPQHIRFVLDVEPAGLRLSVQDDGVGVPEPVPEGTNGKHRGMGIPTMRYRAGMVGGTLQIGRAEGGGTLVTCLVPGGKDRVED